MGGLQAQRAITWSRSCLRRVSRNTEALITGIQPRAEGEVKKKKSELVRNLSECLFFLCHRPSLARLSFDSPTLPELGDSSYAGSALSQVPPPVSFFLSHTCRADSLTSVAFGCPPNRPKDPQARCMPLSDENLGLFVVVPELQCHCAELGQFRHSY
ncbi:hypothetical protein BJV82DRAFT_23474 [Fennellomyces sp. T-0311]|nr:hypothetical protein BJV82DRAFT_23474 [Fennellomyces sp. T-0311]